MLPRILTEGTLHLPENAAAILQVLFAEHRQVIVKREFTGNLSGSRVFLVQPIAVQGAGYPIVVKFAALSLIEKEKRAHQQLQRMLHGMVQIQDSVLPSTGDWGAVSYPLQGGGTFAVESLYDYYSDHPLSETLPAFQRVFRTLENIHNQSRATPGFFWRASYDRLLPVNLLITVSPPPPNVTVHTLDIADAHTMQDLQPGCWVRLQGFAVTKVDLRDRTVTLNLPQQTNRPDSFCVRLRLSENITTYHEHQIVPAIEGQIQATRQSQLQAYLRSLLGNTVDSVTETIVSADGLTLPNPLLKLPTILNQYCAVRTSLIHGDLNLQNILVDADTGYISLIDITEAREDHILHDFLRLETEVVTKLLPDVLQHSGAPVAQTLLKLYQQLHCAIFEPHKLASVQLPPGFEKLFETITAIRHAAYRHFYGDDPSEYYQGLLLYLVGALKFTNLDRHSAAPLPKQAALWCSAAVAWLLDSVPTCKTIPAPVLSAHLPDAMFIAHTSEVKILRQDTECFIPALPGVPLYQGDIVSTFTAAEALVLCQGGTLFTIPDGRNVRIDCPHLPQSWVRTQLDVLSTAQIPNLVRHGALSTLFSLKTVSRLQPTPRNTLIHNPRPTFHWQAVAGATRYRLSLRMPDGITWQRETTRTTLPYPDAVPSLTPGSGYTVVLEALDTLFPPENVYLEVLNAEALAKLQTQKRAIQNADLDETATCYLLALLYYRWQLWDAAIQQLERLTRIKQPLSGALLLQLGELYLSIGLYTRAKRCYRQALAAGKYEKGTYVQTVAHIGLAYTAYAQSDETQVQEDLAMATSGPYDAVVQFVRRQLDMASRSHQQPSANPTPPFAYVRWVAEQIATHLTDEIRLIPDWFMEQLQALQQYTPKRTAEAWSTLGSAELTAMEIVAAVYITTRTLATTFTLAELEKQALSGQLPSTLKSHTQQITQTMLGLTPEQADDFARRYTIFIGDNPDVLRRLLEYQEP